MLIQTLQSGQIMVAGLHGPDFIPLGGEGLSGIAFHPHIHQNRLSVFVEGQAARVVVIVIVVVVSGLYGQTKRAVPGNEKADAGIKNIPVNQFFPTFRR